MGETEIDEATYNEYIDELRGHYTAEKVGRRYPLTLLLVLTSLPLLVPLIRSVI